MFPWKRRNDGFEWREYVRTTILLRRGDRRRRVEDARAAAVDSVKDAGGRLASVGWEWLGAAGRGLSSASRWLIGLPVRAYWRIEPVVAPRLMRATGALLDFLEPLLAFLYRREIRLPVALCGTIAVIGALVRIALHGWDREVMFAVLIAAVAGVLVIVPAMALSGGPSLWARARDRFGHLGFSVPGVTLLRFSGLPAGGGLAAAAIAGVIGVSAWYALDPSSDGPGARVDGPQLSSGPLEGRAVAVSGDSLRIAGSLVRLAGIEAPEREQTCEKAGSGRWRCGEAARVALEKVLRGRRVACDVRTPADPLTATCKIAGEDIAASLVRQGHVFALSAVSGARYAGLEDAARAARTGLWSGTAERPAQFRAKRWEEAKRSAPEGCPIKGQVSDRGRVYLLPWSPSYDRVKVRAGRGDRWFCSEEEALAAGWKATARS